MFYTTRRTQVEKQEKYVSAKNLFSSYVTFKSTNNLLNKKCFCIICYVGKPLVV